MASQRPASSSGLSSILCARDGSALEDLSATLARTLRERHRERVGVDVSVARVENAREHLQVTSSVDLLLYDSMYEYSYSTVDYGVNKEAQSGSSRCTVASRANFVRCQQ